MVVAKFDQGSTASQGDQAAPQAADAGFTLGYPFVFFIAGSAIATDLYRLQKEGHYDKFAVRDAYALGDCVVGCDFFVLGCKCLWSNYRYR